MRVGRASWEGLQRPQGPPMLGRWARLPPPVFSSATLQCPPARAPPAPYAKTNQATLLCTE